MLPRNAINTGACRTAKLQTTAYIKVDSTVSFTGLHCIVCLPNTLQQARWLQTTIWLAAVCVIPCLTDTDLPHSICSKAARSLLQTGCPDEILKTSIFSERELVVKKVHIRYLIS